MGTEHDIAGLEQDLRQLSAGLATLGSGEDVEELIKVVHRPGWTSIAEMFLISNIVKSLNAHVETVGGLKQALIEGSHRITADTRHASGPAPAPPVREGGPHSGGGRGEGGVPPVED
jgi:hypothetical protein